MDLIDMLIHVNHFAGLHQNNLSEVHTNFVVGHKAVKRILNFFYLPQQRFTLPFTPGEEYQSPTSKARLARRRTSMQDSIDMTHFNPALYKSLVST